MRMDMLAFSLVFFLLGMAVGDRDELMKTAIDRNVQWLLKGIREGSFEGPDLARAVVSIFLAELNFFSLGHDIGLELRDKIDSTVLEAKSRNGGHFSDIPSEELALYVQALLVSCNSLKPSKSIWDSVRYYEDNRPRVDHFPSSAMLALCNSRNGALRAIFYSSFISSRPGYVLSDELEYLPMAMECIDSFICKKSCKDSDQPVVRSGYSYYPLNLTIADLQEMIKPGDDMKPLTHIAAAMQILMYSNRLQVSDLPTVADFLLKGQDEDGSWGQSTLNSFFVLPVLSNKSFLDITDNHCRAE